MLVGAVGTVVVVGPAVRLGLSQHGINIKPLGPSVSYVCLYVCEQLHRYALSNCLDLYVIMSHKQFLVMHVIVAIYTQTRRHAVAIS